MRKANNYYERDLAHFEVLHEANNYYKRDPEANNYYNARSNNAAEFFRILRLAFESSRFK